jgi:hypothetical protein
MDQPLQAPMVPIFNYELLIRISNAILVAVSGGSGPVLSQARVACTDQLVSEPEPAVAMAAIHAFIEHRTRPDASGLSLI